MKSFLLWSLLCVVALIGAGCSGGTSVSPQSEEGLPSGLRSLLDEALANFNQYYGNIGTALSYSYLGTIRDVAQKQEVIAEITDPLMARVPKITFEDTLFSGNIVSLQNETISQTELNEWRNLVSSLIGVGMHLVRIYWRANGEDFSTLCVATAEDIVYDNILSNMVIVEGQEQKLRCLDYTIYWLWGGERGKIIAEVTASCDGVINCGRHCSASMTLGEARINCRTRVQGNCCVLEYSFAWATPLVQISVSTDEFTLRTSGLGSSGEGNGNCSDCCEQDFEEGPPTHVE
ncbi:hypothetical protein QBE54_04640 [Thermatribacter velox]|uniref:Lipoprotein n=1 Tax=Thermatribacter velox TaxID=3039681 RepID=A0ABZ2YFW1_9BACT